MARPRFEKTDPAKQEVLLQAAAKEFAQVGYEAASINRILEAAGLSKGAFYYYFDDKVDLAATVLVWVYRDLFAMYDRIQLPDDPARFWDVIGSFMSESLELLERNPHANALMSRLGHAFVNDKALAAKVLEIVSKPVRTLAAIWKRGQELGAVRSDIPVETLVAIMQAIKESLVRTCIPESGVLSPAEMARLADLQLDLFRRVAAPAPTEELP